MTGIDAPASHAFPASPKERKTRLPGWRAILIRDETFCACKASRHPRLIRISTFATSAMPVYC